jgi:hypothetical protein
MTDDEITALVADVRRTLGTTRELWTKIADRAEALDVSPSNVPEKALAVAMRANDFLAVIAQFPHHDKRCNLASLTQIAEWITYTTATAVDVCMFLGSVERTR